MKRLSISSLNMNCIYLFRKLFCHYSFYNRYVGLGIFINHTYSVFNIVSKNYWESTYLYSLIIIIFNFASSIFKYLVRKVVKEKTFLFFNFHRFKTTFSLKRFTVKFMNIEWVYYFRKRFFCWLPKLYQCLFRRQEKTILFLNF